MWKKDTICFTGGRNECLNILSFYTLSDAYFSQEIFDTKYIYIYIYIYPHVAQYVHSAKDQKFRHTVRNTDTVYMKTCSIYPQRTSKLTAQSRAPRVNSLSWSRNSPSAMEPENSLQCSQEPATGPYAESDGSISHSHTLFLQEPLYYYPLSLSFSSSVSKVIRLGAGYPGFDFRYELGFFLLAIASRSDLGYTQPPIQWLKDKVNLSLCSNWAQRHEGVLWSVSIAPRIPWPRH
jgi:hypothetical protein